jgi:RNase P subunit RPR2
MKVIKSSGAGKATKRFKCDGCRATLEVSGKDLTFQSDPRDGSAYTFRCPGCEKVNWVAAALVTPAMRAAARG